MSADGARRPARREQTGGRSAAAGGGGGGGADKARRKPELLRDALNRYLERSGLSDRVDQAGVIPEWASLVGRQIAAVTTPLSVTADGTLFVAVTTNAWMTELSLMEPELVRALNTRGPGRGERRAPLRRIRWLLRR
ncbi:MAG: DciA family protein [Gemmatimonadaceae bacterium]